jgi:hypothetical protein
MLAAALVMTLVVPYLVMALALRLVMALVLL